MTRLADPEVTRCFDLSEMPTAPNPPVRKLQAAPAPLPAPEFDARDLRNVKAHNERIAPVKTWTKASAAKFRRDTAKACGCRLCALALNPPVTFAEYEVFMGAPSPSALSFKAIRFPEVA
jgi:hypothetical protein